MRKLIFGVSALAVAVALVASATVVAKPMPKSEMEPPISASGTSPALYRALPNIETTGFEAADGWVAGFELCGGIPNGFCTILPGTPGWSDACPAAGTNCCAGDPHPQTGWFRSISDQHCAEPHIDVVHPATGTQHLRFAFDPAGGNPLGCAGLNTECRVTAFTPDMGPAQLIGPYTTEFDIAFPNYNGGVTFSYFNVGAADSGTDVYMLFYFDGTIHIFDYAGDNTPGVEVYFPFDTTGAYGHMEAFVDPCAGNVISYSYNGNLLVDMPFTGGAGAAGTTRRGIFASDSGLDTVDLDNFEVTRGPQCPSVCGNGVAEPGEICDGNEGNCPPGRCTQNCTCAPICTAAEPCELVNGANGPFLGPFDPGFGGIWIYEKDTPAVGINFCGTTGADSFIRLYDATANVPHHTQNDDCCSSGAPDNCGSFGNGSTPNAECYGAIGASDPYPACACSNFVDPDPGGTFLLVQNARLVGFGPSFMVNVDKKLVCGEEWENGACCDTNSVTGGDPAGCTDDVAPGDCVGPDKVFTLNKLCATLTCDCIPDCSGAQCGDDGCGGSCGTCDDSLGCTTDACVGRTCEFTPVVCDDGVDCTDDVCVEPAGTCSSTPNDANCDDGLFCNGAETCDGAGCTAPGNPCAEGLTCNEDTDTCDNPVIPTVSEWGLVVMALLLLAGAKVYFGRREVIA